MPTGDAPSRLGCYSRRRFAACLAEREGAGLSLASDHHRRAVRRRRPSSSRLRDACGGRWVGSFGSAGATE